MDFWIKLITDLGALGGVLVIVIFFLRANDRYRDACVNCRREFIDIIRQDLGAIAEARLKLTEELGKLRETIERWRSS